MAPSQMNLSAILLLVVFLLTLVMAAGGKYGWPKCSKLRCHFKKKLYSTTQTLTTHTLLLKLNCLMHPRHLICYIHVDACLDLNHAESMSAGKYVDCHEHLSGNYEGICVGLIHDAKCRRTCFDESSDNYDGFCNFFQCWCLSPCTSEKLRLLPLALQSGIDTYNDIPAAWIIIPTFQALM